MYRPRYFKHKQISAWNSHPSILFQNRKTYPGIERFIDFLVAAALLLGLLSILMDGHRLASFAHTNIKNIYDQMDPSLLYKLIKSVEILFLLSAGVIAYWTEVRFYLNRHIKWMFAILLLWMSGHAIFAFKGGFSNAELIGIKGPAVWWSLLFLFAGYSKERWLRIIYPIVKIIVIVGAIEMTYRVLSLSGGFDRVSAQRTLRMSFRLMLWSAPLIFLVPKKNDIAKIFSLYVLALITIAALLTATRSWLLVCLIYSAVWTYCVFRRAKRPETKMVVVIGVLILILPCVVFLSYNLFSSQIQSGGNLLFSRLAHDSRTWQLEQFFKKVPPIDLLIGTGPRGTWRMGNMDYGYVDGVYILLLFIGGVPLLISYIYIVIYPAIRSFFITRFSLYGSLDFACIFMGLVWGLVMTGLGTYTAPELKINHYIVLLCVGRCWGILNHVLYERYKGQRHFSFNTKILPPMRNSYTQTSRIL